MITDVPSLAERQLLHHGFARHGLFLEVYFWIILDANQPKAIRRFPVADVAN